jgi:hypothetical protein
MTAEFILRVLKEATKNDQAAAQKLLALLKTIVPYWPASVRLVLGILWNSSNHVG